MIAQTMTALYFGASSGQQRVHLKQRKDAVSALQTVRVADAFQSHQKAEKRANQQQIRLFQKRLKGDEYKAALNCRILPPAGKQPGATAFDLLKALAEVRYIKDPKAYFDRQKYDYTAYKSFLKENFTSKEAKTVDALFSYLVEKDFITDVLAAPIDAVPSNGPEEPVLIGYQLTEFGTYALKHFKPVLYKNSDAFFDGETVRVHATKHDLKLFDRQLRED